MGELTIYLQIVLGSLLNKRSHVALGAAIFFLCLHVALGHPMHGQKYAILNRLADKCICLSQLLKIY